MYLTCVVALLLSAAGGLLFMLALPSVVVFTAWPLSGLCLETESRFMQGSSDERANVTGFAHANFNANA
jgi:hypothetical protein